MCEVTLSGIKYRITELEAEVARKQVTIDSRGDLNRKQSERIAGLQKELALWHRKSNNNQRLVDEVNHAHDVNDRAHLLLKHLKAENVKLREALRHIQKNDPIWFDYVVDIIEAALSKGDEKC